jgi:2-polyprenyl-3-methyl-5-hydroxy-6-metoxy-1,4-benzoquinol methylase
MESKMNNVIEHSRKRRKEKLAQLRRQYEIEKKLGARLRSASKEERRHLYRALYDELFQQVVNHPQLLQKASPKLQHVAVSRQMMLLKRFIRPDSIFLEVGSGDCSLSREVAKYVKKVYAIDVSEEITKNETFPQNFRIIISDGCCIPVPKRSISIAYSNNLM